MATPFGRPDDDLAATGRLSRRRADQTGDDPQQGGLAGAGAAEQADDLARADRQVDLVQHQELFAAAFREGSADTADVDERRGLIEHDGLLVSRAAGDARRRHRAAARPDD
ncbi:hypothetical protein ACVWZR_003143 [Bradyrhizobium sp. i1.3.1]